MRRRRYGYGEAFVVGYVAYFYHCVRWDRNRDMFPSGICTVHVFNHGTSCGRNRHATAFRKLHHFAYGALFIKVTICAISASLATQTLAQPPTHRGRRLLHPSWSASDRTSEKMSLSSIRGWICLAHSSTARMFTVVASRWGARSRKHGGIPSTSRQPSVQITSSISSLTGTGGPMVR
jgi:hypothetical protein